MFEPWCLGVCFAGSFLPVYCRFVSRIPPLIFGPASVRTHCRIFMLFPLPAERRYIGLFAPNSIPGQDRYKHGLDSDLLLSRLHGRRSRSDSFAFRLEDLYSQESEEFFVSVVCFICSFFIEKINRIIISFYSPPKNGGKEKESIARFFCSHGSHGNMGFKSTARICCDLVLCILSCFQSSITFLTGRRGARMEEGIGEIGSRRSWTATCTIPYVNRQGPIL